VRGGDVYVGGHFEQAGNVPATHFAVWKEDGTTGPNCRASSPTHGFASMSSSPFVSFRFGRWNMIQAGIRDRYMPGRPASSSIASDVSPNPFSTAVSLRFTLPRGGRIATLLDGELPAGDHVTSWHPGGVSDGIYFYRITSDALAVTSRLVLTR
jgi:hypothetical protein